MILQQKYWYATALKKVWATSLESFFKKKMQKLSMQDLNKQKLEYLGNNVSKKNQNQK